MTFKKGDQVKRRPEARDKGAWHLDDKTLTVESADERNLVLSGIVGTWCPDYFALVVAAKPEQPVITGRKDDSGKLDMTLLDDMPRALEAVVEVMQWAIKDKAPKPYDRGSWLGVEPDRYRAAILRHRTAAAKQTLGSAAPARHQRDHETNLLHAAHEACSALMALENILRELENTR